MSTPAHSFQHRVTVDGVALVERVTGVIYSIRDLGHDPNGGAAGGGECEERRGLHFDSGNTGRGVRRQLCASLPVGGVRRPDPALRRRKSERMQFRE